MSYVIWTLNMLFITEPQFFSFVKLVCIYSSVSGHLGCFHTLTIVSNAAMNVGVRVSF